jgi:eukaryotic-like serine/threonine-protein kinase
MASRILEQPVKTIGNYEIIDLLGAGGMSHVYKARHATTGEVVAIKVPQERVVTNPVALKRFEQEFGVARLIKHPHLVRVLQYSHTDDKPYIVMEFVEGQSLGDRIQREGALPEAEAVRIIAQAASALQAAHQHKIIHRDVKPDNILLTARGKAKLTDLGLAKDLEAEHNLTMPMRGMGTPNFIAPEQFNDAKHADARCDVYSLAATLYMAVTGQAPFQARGNLSIWKKKLSNDLVSPRQLVPSLSERVEAAICRALAADPEGRPATCRQFMQELRGAKAPAGVNGGGATTSVYPSAVIPRRPAVERRASVRYVSRLKGSCRPLASERKWRWNATVRDVSAGGIGLLLNRRFEPCTVLRVKLPTTGSSRQRIYLVRVVRVQAHSPKTWIVGCIFPRRLSEEEVQTLL